MRCWAIRAVQPLGNNRTNGHAAGTPDSGQYVAGSLKQSCSPAEERQRSLHDADNVLAPRLIPHEHPQWRVDRMVEGGLVQSAYNGFFRVESSLRHTRPRPRLRPLEYLAIRITPCRRSRLKG